MSDSGNLLFVPGTKYCIKKCSVPTERRANNNLLPFPWMNFRKVLFPAGRKEYTYPEITVNKGIRKYSNEKKK